MAAGDTTETLTSNIFPNPVLPRTDVSYPIIIDYCGVCTLPTEVSSLFCATALLKRQRGSWCTLKQEKYFYFSQYCDYSPEPDKCREWLKQNLPDHFRQLEPGAAEVPTLAKTDDDPAGDAEGDDDKKKRQTRGGKARVKLPVVEEKKKPGTIKLSIASRGKKKYVTVITGLGSHGIDLKLAAKFFGQKFACGSSLTGDDEIVIQGDVKDDLLDLIPDKWPDVDEDQIEDLGEQRR